MREILFRGKRVDNGEWIEGGYFVCLHEGQHCPVIFNLSNGVVKVDGNTVCQFTGLTDKNGTNIFEGDIVFNSNKILITCQDDKRLYLVKWVEGKYIETNSHIWLGQHPEFVFEKIQYDKKYMSLIFNQNQIEVIGNIHDNPELIPNQNNDL